jgi:hypothetical protein
MKWTELARNRVETSGSVSRESVGCLCSYEIFRIRNKCHCVKYGSSRQQSIREAEYFHLRKARRLEEPEPSDELS